MRIYLLYVAYLQQNTLYGGLADMESKRYAIGYRVIHWTFGFGTVIKLEEDSVKVKFDSGKTRNILENSYSMLVLSRG